MHERRDAREMYVDRKSIFEDVHPYTAVGAGGGVPPFDPAFATSMEANGSVLGGGCFGAVKYFQNERRSLRGMSTTV